MFKYSPILERSSIWNLKYTFSFSPIRKICYITYNLMEKKIPESGRLSNLCIRIGLRIRKSLQPCECNIWKQARRKRCGMAAVAAPKICRERGKKEEKLGRKKEKRGERKERRIGERKGEESKRERCTMIRPMGVKHPLRTVKRL